MLSGDKTGKSYYEASYYEARLTLAWIRTKDGGGRMELFREGE